ncbi:MAG: AAA family ATPase [Magnetococcales bacterium]|nr:AAA family ATPase [Magnetococcales bacterium]
MADVSELKARLTGDVLRVVVHLLPGGRKNGQEWECGSLAGDAGKSLRVHLSGDKAGIWSDFASGDKGDLIDLWRLARRLTMAETIREIKAWLGVTDPAFESNRRKSYRKPSLPRTAPQGANRVWDYLMGVRRLSREALMAYRVMTVDRIGPWEEGKQAWFGDWIGFPSYHEDDLKLVKYLNLERKDGKKIILPEPGCEPILFGWQAIPDDAREVVITEGEIDAITAWDYGLPALSVPFGGGAGAKQQWLDSEFPRLDRFEVIYLCLDSDAVGKAAAAELIDRLGRHRCRVVTLPHKDINDCRMRGVTREQIAECFRSAVTVDPGELRNARDFLGEVIEAFYPTGEREPGMSTPFGKLDGKFLFRPGELTVWTGGTGSGKSQLLGFITVAGMSREERFCIASLEMRPQQLLKRMAKQISGLDVPSVEYLTRIHDFYADHLWLFTLVGKSSVTRLVEVFDYARRRYGVTHFVVDSLMRIEGAGGDNYSEQEKVVFALTNFALNHNVHVHLVAHARKSNPQIGGSVNPGVEDIKGASEVANNASNVLGVSRDRRHEQKLAKAEEQVKRGGSVPDIDDLRSKPGVFLTVSKQRNGDWDGVIPLWFDRQTFQYRDRYSQDPVKFLAFERPEPDKYPWGEEAWF